TGARWPNRCRPPSSAATSTISCGSWTRCAPRAIGSGSQSYAARAPRRGPPARRRGPPPPPPRAPPAPRRPARGARPPRGRGRRAGRCAPGRLPGVAASTHEGADLAPHAPYGPPAVLAAHERVLRGEDLTGVTLPGPPVLDVPLRLADWEPGYFLAHYRSDGV